MQGLLLVPLVAQEKVSRNLITWPVALEALDSTPLMCPRSNRIGLVGVDCSLSQLSCLGRAPECSSWTPFIKIGASSRT